MEDNTFYQWPPTVVMNNLPPTLPDVAGPSDVQAHHRISVFRYNLQDFGDHHMVTGNTDIPTGTRDWDHKHDDPHLSSGYPLDYISTSLDLGYHNYLPTQDYTLSTPAWNMIGNDDFQYIPEPQPEMVTGGDDTQYTSVDFQHMHSLTGSDVTTLVPSSSYSQTLRQSRVQDLELVVGDLVNVEAMEHTHDTPDPTSWLLRQQFDLAAEINAVPPVLNDKSTRNTIGSEFIGESSTPETVLYGIENYDESKGSFLKDDVISNAKGITSEGRCVRCQRMKIKCKEDGITCGPCNSVPYTCCIRLEHLFPPLTSPDLYTDLDVTTIEYLGSSGTTPLRRRAQIFLPSEKHKLNIFLTCKVDVYRLRFSDPSYSTLNMIGLWEDMRSPLTQKQFGWDQVLSCSLITGSLPPKHMIYQFILESAGIRPSGVIGGLQGPLYASAMCYIKDICRPLTKHELVALTLIHTSLYNVYHSKLSMVLENQHEAAFRVCPRLRAQVFDPLFLETGQELQAKLKEAVKNYQHSQKEEHLPLCLVMWMLMLMYRHCNVQTEKAASAFAIIDQVSVRVVDKENSRFAPDLEMRRESTKTSIDTIKVLHKALFKTMGKPIGPILDVESRIGCNKCAHKNQPGSCPHNSELETKLSSLRQAVWRQQADAQMWGNGPGADMDDVMGYPPRDNKELDAESLDDVENPVIGPPPSEKTLSTSKRLDSDAMSVYTQSSSNRKHPGFSDLQEAQGRLNEEVREVDAWKWPSNEWILAGMGNFEDGLEESDDFEIDPDEFGSWK